MNPKFTPFCMDIRLLHNLNELELQSFWVHRLNKSTCFFAVKQERFIVLNFVCIIA